MTVDQVMFYVPGKPQTAGSKRGFVNPKTGGVIITEGGDKDVKARKTAWRTDLRAEASKAIEGLEGWPAPKDTALYVRFVVVRKRPSDQLRTGRHAGVVKDWALSLRPTTIPDVLKVARAAEDALTSVLWKDDAQIVAERLDKAYGDQVGLDVRAEGLLVLVHVAGPYEGPTIAQRAV